LSPPPGTALPPNILFHLGTPASKTNGDFGKMFKHFKHTLVLIDQNPNSIVIDKTPRPI